MKNYLLFLLCIFLLTSCRPKEEPEAPSDVARYVDSLLRVTDSLGRLLAVKDSIAKDSMVAVQQPAPVKDSAAKTTVSAKPKAADPESDSSFYYYTAPPRKVSVIVTPWRNGRRKVLLFDPFGKKTYEIDDVRLSYSETSRLESFHSNGAVSKITIHNNPGGSRYWYETYITFGINNEPQWKESQQFPQESLELPKKFYWDAKSQSWKRQEVVEEQPAPGK